MVKLCRFLAAVFLLFAGSSIAAQEIESSVDRNEIARGEALTFTIRVFDQRQGMQLDLTPLTEDIAVCSLVACRGASR